MIPPEKPDIIYLLKDPAANIFTYGLYSVRIVNMKDAALDAKAP
jgi:hypothetical protein